MRACLLSGLRARRSNLECKLKVRQFEAAKLHPVYGDLFVHATRADAGSSVSVNGYLAGAHPRRRNQLVLVVAPATGLRADAPVAAPASATRPSPAGAAVVELARVFVDLASRYDVPEHTVQFAVLDGPDVAGALIDLLETPTWPLASTLTVVGVGYDEQAGRAVSAWLADRAATDSLSIAFTAVAPPRRVTDRAPGRPTFVAEAMAHVEAAYPVVLAAATTDLPFAPVDPDTLRLPRIDP